MWEINLSIGLNTGKLARGNQKWSVDLAFQYSGSSQSYCVQVREKDIDAKAFLEDLTGPGQAEAFVGCILEKAGIFYIHHTKESEKNQTFPALLHQSVTSDQAQALAELFGNRFVIPASGICLYLIADLKKMSIFSDLIRIGYDGNEQLVLLGYLTKGTGEKLDKSFYAILPGIELFCAVTFRNVLLIYKEKGCSSVYFALSGIIELQLEKYFLKFQGELEITNTGYSAEMQLNGETDLLSFAAGAEGYLYLEDPVFHMQCQYASSDRSDSRRYYLQASIRLANMIFCGRVFWENEEKASPNGRIEAALETNLSLETLLRPLFYGYEEKGVLFDIILEEGSWMSYSFGEKREFFLHLKASIKIVHLLRLSGKVHITGEGFQVRLSAEDSINLGPLILEPVGEQHELGLTVKFQKGMKQGSKKLEITAAASFFGEKLIGGTFIYIAENGDWCIQAKVQMPDTIKTIFGEKLTVIYDSAAGFRLEDFSEITYVGEAVNFLRQLKKYMQMEKSDVCSKLKEGSGEKNLHSSFKIKPGLKGKLEEGKAVKLTLKGILRVEDQERNLLLERKIGEENEISITWESGMRFQDILGQIEIVLEKSVEQILNALFQDVNFDELEKILKVIAEGMLKEYAEGLLCRKLINENNARKLKPSEPSGKDSGSKEGKDSGSKGGKDSGSKEGGGSGSGGMAEGAGGFAFGGGTLMENAGEYFGGIAIIIFSGVIGEERKADEKLPYPDIFGRMEEMFLTIEMRSVKGATDYEIALTWENKGHKEQRIRWKAKENPPEISFLEIPLKGKFYLAVRAINSKNENLSSDWSPENLVGEIGCREIVFWCLHQSLCIRDCFQMLKQHGFDNNEDNEVRTVLQYYMTPKIKEDLVKEHFQKGDSAGFCLRHLADEFPHLTSGEILKCMWYEGYREEEIKQAIIANRSGLTWRELDGLLEKMLKLEGRCMELDHKISELLEQRAKNQLTKQELLSEIAILLANNSPLDVAKVLKEMGYSAKEIAKLMSDTVSMVHKAAGIGEVILDSDVYPETNRKEMEEILRKTFPEENIEKVLEILYPVMVSVPANVIWYDTQVIIEEDELVTVIYVDGLWSVNQQHHTKYGAEGIQKFTAKDQYLLPGQKEGCLVGKIGEDVAFYIGKKAVLPKGNGRLFLAANDDVFQRYGNGYQDNSGALTVKISKDYR